MIRNISGAVNWAGFAVNSCYSNFDSSRLYNEHKDLYKQYEVKSTVKRFTII